MHPALIEFQTIGPLAGGVDIEFRDIETIKHRQRPRSADDRIIAAYRFAGCQRTVRQRECTDV